MLIASPFDFALNESTFTLIGGGKKKGILIEKLTEAVDLFGV